MKDFSIKINNIINEITKYEEHTQKQPYLTQQKEHFFAL